MRILLLVLLAVCTGFAGVKKTVCASGCDYATMQAAEDNFTKSYTGVGIDTIAPLAGSHNGSCLVNGQTNVNANNHILILGPAMTGIFGDPSHAVLTNSAAAYTLYMLTGYHEIKNIEITNTSANAGFISVANLYLNAVGLIVNNVIAKTNSNQIVIESSNTTIIRNVIAYNSSIYTPPVISHFTGTASFLQNFIIYGQGVGYSHGSGTATLQNGYAYTGNADSSSFKVVTGTCTRSYIASDDASASGTGSLTNVSLANASFVNAPTNFLITTSSSLYNVGTNLVSTFINDILNEEVLNWSMSANDPSSDIPLANFQCTDGFCAMVSSLNHDSIMTYWKGDTTSSGLIEDFAFNSKRGTRTSTSVTRGRFGQTAVMSAYPGAVAFPYVRIGGKNKFTHATVFNMNVTPAFRAMYSMYTSAAVRYQLLTNGPAFTWNFDGATAAFNFTGEFVTGQYVCLVIVYDGTESSNAARFKVYANGIQRTLTFGGTIPTVKSAQSTAFNYAFPGTYDFLGNIDEMVFWKGTLTDAQAILVSANGSLRTSYSAIPSQTIYSWSKKTPFNAVVTPRVLGRTIILSVRDSTGVTNYNSISKTLAVNDSIIADSVPFVRGGWARLYTTIDYLGMPLLRDSSTVFGIGPIFLAVGQSNMVGQGDQPYTTVTHRSSMWNRGGWKPLRDPIDSNKTHAVNLDYNGVAIGGSMFPSFVNSLTPKINAAVGVIPSAVNGSPVWNSPSTGSSWLFPVTTTTDTANNIFNPAIIRARAAGHIDAILWYQGEEDARTNHTTQQHIDSLTKLIRNFRDSLARPNLPFLMVNIADGYGGAYTSTNLANIRTAIETVGNTVPNSKVLCRPYDLGYAIKADGIHLTTASQNLLGACMAEGYYNFYYGINTNRSKSPMWRMGVAPR